MTDYLRHLLAWSVWKLMLKDTYLYKYLCADSSHSWLSKYEEEVSFSLRATDEFPCAHKFRQIFFQHVNIKYFSLPTF
jgi:hypothetical protein